MNETALANAGSHSTYAGAGITGFGWLLSNEFVALVGLILAVGGFAINWYYRARRDRREQQEHEARMRGELS